MKTVTLECPLCLAWEAVSDSETEAVDMFTDHIRVQHADRCLTPGTVRR